MRGVWIGVAGICALGAMSILWAVSGAEGAGPPTRAAGAAMRAGVEAPQAERERRGSARERSPARKAEVARATQLDRVRTEVRSREPRVADREERAGVRVETRDELVAGLLDRVERHAQTAGWSDEVVGRVEDTILDVTADIGERLHSVDVGEAKWEDVKREVRQLRLDQAQTLRGLLGDEAFEDFVGAVALERFQGEEPVRGRL